jgi:hypothetical protein
VGPRGGMGVLEKRKMYARADLKEVALYNGLPRTEQCGVLTPVGGQTFRTRPDRPWGSPTSSIGHWVLLRGKAAGTWR